MMRARANAKKLNVTIKPAKNPKKKLDVYNRCGDKVASIGASAYEDYTKHRDPVRRRNYKKRFEKSRHKVGSNSYYADKILWD